MNVPTLIALVRILQLRRTEDTCRGAVDAVHDDDTMIRVREKIEMSQF